MRSYDAARSLFSFISIVAWVCIVGGALAGLIGGNAASRMSYRGDGMAFLMGMLPGVVIVIVGFLTLAMAQIGRAGVDTAEYTQQMLQLSRDHLNVSRQTLRQGEELKQGFDALQTRSNAAPTASYAGLAAQEPNLSSDGTPATAPTDIEYKGRKVHVLKNGYRFLGMEFKTLEATHAYIDQLGVNPAAVLRASRET